MNTFSSVASLLQMGGYAAYVWPAYTIVFLVLIMQLWLARRRFKCFLKRQRNNNANTS